MRRSQRALPIVAALLAISLAAHGGNTRAFWTQAPSADLTTTINALNHGMATITLTATFHTDQGATIDRVTASVAPNARWNFTTANTGNATLDAQLPQYVTGSVLIYGDSSSQSFGAYATIYKTTSISGFNFTLPNTLDVSTDTTTTATIITTTDTTTTTTDTTTTSTDTCGNDAGNGNVIIAGPSGPTGADFDQIFRSLTIHPTDPNTVWVGTERNGFLKTTDGGTTWTRYRSGLRHTDTLYPEIWDIAVSPSDPSILYAATLDSPGPVTGDYPSSIAGIYKSTDGGQTWVRKNCGINTSRINSIRFDAADADIAVAGLEGETVSFDALAGQYYDGGLFRTTDGGTNWSEIAIDANDGKNGFWHLLARGSSPTTFLTYGMNYNDLSQNHGFLRSTDSGATWSAFGSGLKNLKITSIGASADGTKVYANVRDSYTMQVSTDSGATFTETANIQANGPIAVSPSDANLVVYAGSTTVYRSTDGLTTTASVLSAGGSVNDIAFAPSDPTTVYVGAAGFLIYKSTDSGATFTLLKNLRADVLNAE